MNVIFGLAEIGIMPVSGVHPPKEAFMRRYFVLVLLFLVGVSACQRQHGEVVLPSPTPTVAAPTPTAVAAPPRTLRVWLPAMVSKENNAAAYEALAARIQAFAAAHSVTAEIRVKPTSGEAGMLTTLGAARLVAPGAVPDVVLMSRAQMEAAAVKGLAFPLTSEAFATPLTTDDWFPYARQQAMVQGVAYGVPFGGDALGLLYHPEAATPPATWNAWLRAPQQWLLPLGDPQAVALLALYRAAGGAWEDDNGRPTLQEEPLRRTLALLQEAAQSGRLDGHLTELTSDAMLWARHQGDAQVFMLTYLSHLLPGPDPRRMAPIPPASAEGQPVALANGLLWTLTTPDAVRQPLALALIADLNQTDFVASWTEAAGYLPPRQSCLDRWESADHSAVVKEIVPYLQVFPSQQVITVVSPVLQHAAAQVVAGRQAPESAAQWAISTLNGQSGQ